MGGSPVIEMAGKTFGLLTVVCREGTYRKFAAWRCRCTCGTEVIVSGQRLRQGKRKACARNGHFWASNSRPGITQKYPLEYRSWCHMRGRCQTKKKRSKNWRLYAGRGITVCERWNSFQNFIDDMGRKPTPKHTIERKDVNGNYEPNNCRWATRKEQTRNLRRSVYVEVEGVKVLLVEVTEKLGLDRSLVYGRLKNGWSLEEALSIPVHKRDPVVAEALHPNVVRGRLKIGWSPEDALSIPIRRHKAQRKKKRSPT